MPQPEQHGLQRCGQHAGAGRAAEPVAEMALQEVAEQHLLTEGRGGPADREHPSSIGVLPAISTCDHVSSCDFRIAAPSRTMADHVVPDSLRG